MASTFIKLPVVSGSGPSAGVDSFNSRTGVVVSQLGDYSATIVSNAPSGNITATTVQGALNQLDSIKQQVITGAASSITSVNLTANRALISDALGKVAVSIATSTELSYLSGVTSNIQAQLNARQPLDSDLTAISGLITNGIIIRTGTGTATTRSITSDSSISVSNADGISGNPNLALPVQGLIIPGSYTSANITVDDRGIVKAVSNGSASDFDPEHTLLLGDDFSGTTVGLGSYGWTQTITGTGATVVLTDTTFINLTGRALGVARLTPGTSANGRVTIHSNVSAFNSGYCSYYAKMRMTLNSIGLVGETFEHTFGLIDNTGGSTDHTDGVYFRLFANGVNIFWETVTSSSSTRSSTITSSPVLINNFQLFEIFLNESATAAQFYVDGVLVATHTMNIPSINEYFGFGAKIIRQTANTTNFFAYTDYMYLKAIYSSPRG